MSTLLTQKGVITLVNVVLGLISVVLASVIDAILGIEMTHTFATIFSFCIVFYLSNEVYNHIKAKTMPTILEWCKYGCAIVALVLWAIGFVYRSVYCLIFGIIFLIVIFVIMMIEQRKLKKTTTE